MPRPILDRAIKTYAFIAHNRWWADWISLPHITVRTLLNGTYFESALHPFCHRFINKILHNTSYPFLGKQTRRPGRSSKWSRWTECWIEIFAKNQIPMSGGWGGGSGIQLPTFDAESKSAKILYTLCWSFSLCWSFWAKSIPTRFVLAEYNWSLYTSCKRDHNDTTSQTQTTCSLLFSDSVKYQLLYNDKTSSKSKVSHSEFMVPFGVCTFSIQKLQEYPFHKEITLWNFWRKALDSFEVLQSM